MSRQNKNFANLFVSVFFLFALIAALSCSPASEPSAAAQPPQSPKEMFDIQFRGTLSHGIVFSSGDGSQEAPFKILIDESVSLRGYPLELSELFSNVESVEEIAKSGAIELDASTSASIKPSLGSKLSLKLHGAHDEKYTELYFQDSARLTNAMQIGEAVLAAADRGQVANDSEIVVTLYKKSSEVAGSVELKSLFDDYDHQIFKITAFKIDETAQLSRAVSERVGDKIDFPTYMIEDAQSILVEFQPNSSVNSLLYPARSQVVRIVLDSKVMSSLAFSDAWEDDHSKWSNTSFRRRDRGEHPEEARVLESAWNDSLDLSSYLKINDGETFTVRLYSTDNAEIIYPQGARDGADYDLGSAVIFGSGQNNYKFEIVGDSAAAIFEFIGSGGEYVEKKLYVKVQLTLAVSTMVIADTIPKDFFLAAEPLVGHGSETSPYEFTVLTQGVTPSLLVKEQIGNLAFAVRKDEPSTAFVNLNDPHNPSLSVCPGAVGDGHLTAGSWLLRISDPGSTEYELKSLYFKLFFPIQPSKLSVSESYRDDHEGSEESPVEVTIPLGELTLAHLITSTGKPLTYEVVKAGSGLAEGTSISVPRLGVGVEIDETTLTRGFLVLKVSELQDNYTAGAAFFFKLTFESTSAGLKPNINYPITPSGNGLSSDTAISVPQIGQEQSLVLTDLIDSSAGSTTYFLLSIAGAIALPSGVPLRVGEQFGASSIAIAADTPWMIRVIDSDPDNTELESLYFAVTFTHNPSTFFKNSNYITNSGDGSVASPYTSTVAAGSSLILSDLVTNESAGGTLSYSVDGATVTANSLQLGVDGLTSGTKTIVASDTGDSITAGHSLYFAITFALNPSTLVKNSNYRTSSGVGSSASPYVATVAAGSSLTLADLVSGASGTLSYSIDDATVTASSLQLGVDGLTSGTKTIVVSDTGDNVSEGRSLYFAVTFALNPSTLVKNSNYRTSSGAGSSASPYVSTVAAGSSLTLADLVSGASANGTLSYTVDNETITASSLQLGVDGLTSGRKNIVVSDSGDSVSEGRSLYFAVTFALNPSTLVKNSNYSTSSGAGSSASPYVATVAAGSSLTLADLVSGASGTLSYSIDDATVTASSLQLGVDGLTSGTKTIVVSDTGDNVSEGRSLYFAVTFALNPSTLVKNSNYRTSSGAGSSASPYVSTVAAGSSLTLADLVSGASADGTLSYTVDNETITASSLQVGVDNLTAGTKAIVVNDTGDNVNEGRNLYFAIIFAKNASTLVKNNNYSTSSGAGSSASPYVATVAAGSSLTLADLVSGASANGTLSYTVDNETITASSLQVGVDNFTAGTKTIVVSDTGDSVSEGRSLYFAITFALNPSTLVKKRNYSTSSGAGSSASPYVATVAAGSSLTLADLVTGQSAGGTLSYSVDGATVTANSLQLGVDGLTSGTKTIVASDTGDSITAGHSLYFAITFALNPSTLVKNSNYRTSSGVGSSASPYVATVAAGSSLTLADLVSGASGTLSYSIDDATVTASSLQLGVDGLTSGTKTIVVSDTGDNVSEGRSLYFAVTFALNPSTLVKNSNYRTSSGAGSSASPYVATVAAGSSLILSDLVTNESAGGTLSYSVDGATVTANSLQLGVDGLTSGTKTIVASDTGDSITVGHSLYFAVTFALNPSTLVKNSNYRTSSGAGSSASPYVSTVAAGSSLTLADLVSGASANGTLSYTVDNETITASSLQVGVDNLTAGTKAIVVNDTGDNVNEGRNLYFAIIFAKNASTLVKNNNYSTSSGAGSSASPYVATVAAGSSLTLADLVSGASADGTLSYTVDDETITASSLQVGVDNLTAGTKAIVVNDTGDNVNEGRNLYFAIIFAKNASTLVKNNNYSTSSGAGSSASPYVATVAAGSSLTLADLVSGASADGTLSYTVDDETITASSLQVGVDNLTAGTKAIVVNDTGDNVNEGRNLYFAITFAKNASTLVKNNNYSTSSGAGSSASPYVATVAAGSSLTLADLVSGASADGTLSYTVDDETITASSLQVGVDNFTAGTKTIVVSDTGDSVSEGRSLYFAITFAKNASTLVKKNNYSTSSGAGSSASPYLATVAAGSSLTLANLVSGESADGALSYTVDNETITASSLQVGVAGLTSGRKNIVVSDSGDSFTAGRSLYFAVTFALNPSTLVKNNNYSTSSGAGSSASPYVATVAAGSSLTLANLITGQSAGGTLSYSIDDATITASSLQVGVDNLTAGTKAIVVSDTGDNVSEGRNLYFAITFALNPSRLVKNSNYSSSSGVGSSSSPYLATVAAGGSLTLADLVTGQSAGGTLSYSIDDVPVTASSLQVGVDNLTAGTKTIVVSDTGDSVSEGRSLYFAITFAKNASTLVKNSNYRTSSGVGSSVSPYVATVAAGSSLTLANLITGQSAGGTLSYSIDDATITASSLQVGVDNLTAGTKAIVVSDTGDNVSEGRNLYFAITFALNPSTLVKNNNYSSSSGVGSSASPYVATVAAGSSLTLANLITGQSAGGTLSYSVDGATVTASSLQVGVDNLTAGTKAIVVSDTGDSVNEGHSLYFTVTFALNPSRLVKNSNYSTSSGVGSSASPYLATVAAGSSLTLADLVTGQSAGGTLSYSIDDVPVTASSLQVGVDNLTAGTKAIVVSDTGDSVSEGRILYFTVTFAKNASTLVKNSNYSSSSGVGSSASPYLATVAAGSSLTLADLVSGASAGGTLSYSVDDVPVTASSLQVGVDNLTAGTKTIVVSDTGDSVSEGHSLYFAVTFATSLPAADNRYMPSLRFGGPEVVLTGSMIAGEISFSVDLLADTEQVIYSSADSEFKYVYQQNGDVYDLSLVTNQGNTVLKANLPAGTYNFTLIKVPSSNHYTIEASVTDAYHAEVPLTHSTSTIRENFDAFSNPVIGADAHTSNRRAVRVVNNVRWAFQPAAPQLSLTAADNFSALAAHSSVGSTFYVRVSGLIAGDQFELFSAVSSQTSFSSLATKTVGAGKSFLEFAVTGLEHGTSYEFFVKPAASNANLLASPRSIAVTANTSVPETVAGFMKLGGQLARQGSRANLESLVVVPATGHSFAVGDQVFLYELNANNKRVAIADATALAHTFTTQNLTQSLNIDLSGITFQERAYRLVVELVTPLGNKADADFNADPNAVDTIFDVTVDLTPPQLFFNFKDTTTFVISANEDLADGATIGNGLIFTDGQGNPLTIRLTPEYIARSSSSGKNAHYEVTLSNVLDARAVLNLAAGTVTDTAGNGNTMIQKNLFPNLSSITASSTTIGSSSDQISLTFNFTQEIDASSFTAADLEIVNANGVPVSSNAPTLGEITPDTGTSQTIRVTLTAAAHFDNQVRVKMKDDNSVSLAGSSFGGQVTGQSPLIDIDRKTPTPTLSFAVDKVDPNTNIELTLSFDEAVTGDIEADHFTLGAGGSLSNITRKNDTTFTATLTTPSTATTNYSLILNAGVINDAYGNTNSASAAATIDVEETAPIPSFSAAPIPRHGGATTVTITFPETVTGFSSDDLILTNTISASAFTEVTPNKVYTVFLTTQSHWNSGDAILRMASNAYQINSKNNPALSYVIPVSNQLTPPTLVSVTETNNSIVITNSSDSQTLPLTGVQVKLTVSAVAGDTLELFLDGNRVAMQTIATTGTQDISIEDPESKTNGVRLAYKARLKDPQGHLSQSSRLLYVNFVDNNAPTPPKISGPVANVSFTDNFSSAATSWRFDGTANSATIHNGRLRLTANNAYYKNGIAIQDDLIFSPQGEIVFEATFIFGNKRNAADGMAFFTYDAQDTSVLNRTYKAGHELVVTEGLLPSLFFAVGLQDYRTQKIKFAAPTSRENDNSNPFSNARNIFWFDPNAGGTTAHRLRITMKNQRVVVERATFSNGVVDESTWSEILSQGFGNNAYIPENIKIGFSGSTGGATNYHAIDDVSVNAQLFIPYTTGENAIQAAPSGIALTVGEQANNGGSLAIAGVRVRISSGYQPSDSLSFSGSSTQFKTSVLGNEFTIEAATGQSPSTAEFLTALNAVNFSAAQRGERTLSWQAFSMNGTTPIYSQPYISEIRVSSAS